MGNVNVDDMIEHDEDGHDEDMDDEVKDEEINAVAGGS